VQFAKLKKLNCLCNLPGIIFGNSPLWDMFRSGPLASWTGQAEEIIIRP